MKRLFKLAGICLLGFSTFASADSTKFYGTFYTALLADKSDYSVVDNGSRVGIKFERSDLHPFWSAGLRAEYGVNAAQRSKSFELKDGALSATKTGAPFSNRLGYIYFKYDNNLTISIGKQWSPFYEVTSVTDIFSIFGASASGAFSLSTDGGYLGTGRADNSIRLSYNYGKIKFSTIYVATANEELELLDKDGNNLSGNPKRIYKGSYGGAVQYNDTELSLGIASMNGIFNSDGDEQNSHATTFSARYKLSDFTFAGVYTLSRRIEVDNDGVIIGAKGIEGVVKYNISEFLNFSLGYNYLKPDDKTYKLRSQNKYMIDQYILSLSYAKDYFSAALEGSINSSKNSDGKDSSNNIIGLSLGLTFN